MKTNYWKQKRLQEKRYRKQISRIRKEKKFIDSDSSPFAKEYRSKIKYDLERIKKFKFNLDEFLNKNGTIYYGTLDHHIKMPRIFCLEKKYDEVILKFSEIRSTIISGKFDTIIIDFTLTTEVSFEVLFLLKVILDEYLNYLKKQDLKLTELKLAPNIRIRKPKNVDVSNKLIANEILIKTSINEEEALIPITKTKMIKGSKKQKNYHENKKGFAGKKIRELIDRGLSSHGYILSDEGINNLDGIISEVLNNAEDHSQEIDSWYTYGNLFETQSLKGNDNFVGEVNLAFLNFGDSIFQGFEKTKYDNSECYNQMDSLTNNIIAKSNNFDKESLFTLYALQEGYSRLKNEEKSRGTGTMKFINSFLNLGDFEDLERQYSPKLLIYSGKTLLKCDNKFKPFTVDNSYYLSLNSTKNLLDSPETSHLKKLRLNFPGTFLVVKIYLNKSQLQKKIRDNGQEDD
jgi:hypothetical protein